MQHMVHMLVFLLNTLHKVLLWSACSGVLFIGNSKCNVDLINLVSQAECLDGQILLIKPYNLDVVLFFF